MFKKWCLLGGFALVGCLTYSLLHAEPTSKGAAALAQAAADGKIAYLIFYRDGNAPTQAVTQAVQAHSEKYTAKAVWFSVGVTDPAEKALVDKFQVSRAPTPLVLGVHPNGAVTGVFQKPMTEAEFVQTLVSPTKAECMKRLQADQLVLLCVQAPGQQAVPQGVKEFQADPQFAQRTQVLTVQLNDPNEAAFFTYLQIDPQTTTPLTVFMAPPGVMVGKFPSTASKADLARSLHQAGKCCDDKNCKHNR
jgi:hypothetical protein